jgi:hypothetical protein
LLEQGLPDAADDAADRLAARGSWIDDFAGIVRAHETVQPDEPQLLVDADLGEECREAEDTGRGL